MSLRGGQVAIDSAGNITCAACDCTQAGAGATQIHCPTGVISPGLINAHDHITYTQNAPAPDSGERYEQRNDWRKGQRGHTKIATPGGASVPQIQWGELRFILGGATSTVGSGAAPGLLRNLDKPANLEAGLAAHAGVQFQTFPLGDTNGLQLASGCGYNFTDTAASIANDKSYEPHIAEGVDSVAHNEFVCSSSSVGGAQDLTQPQSAFIHSVALQAADYQQMAMEGTSVVWSPRSNIRLYGNTAQVTVAASFHTRIALGTDWTASGSMNLLRELRCADELNQKYYDKFFSDEQLWEMVTKNAAGATGFDDALGVLAQGHLADIAIFDGRSNADFRAVVAAEPAGVVLVLRGGKPLYGDASLLSALSVPNCDSFDVCGTAKSACLMGEVGKTFDALKAAAGGVYGLFFCGTPDVEPTCVPSRPKAVMSSTIYTGQITATDSDGDGIPDATDNCPRHFNPIRPLDGAVQADADLDGAGDACDPCPLDPMNVCTKS